MDQITYEKVSETEVKEIIQKPAPLPEERVIPLDEYVTEEQKLVGDLAFVQAQLDVVRQKIITIKELGVKESHELVKEEIKEEVVEELLENELVKGDKV